MSSLQPVFSDPTQRRWRLARRFLFYTAGASSFLLTVFIISIILTPFLSVPTLQLHQKVAARSRAAKPVKRVSNTARERQFQRVRARLFDLSSKSDGRASVPSKGRNGPIPTAAFFVNWDEASFTSLTHNARSMSRLYAQWATLSDTEGNVKSLVDGRVLRWIQKNRPMPVFPAVTNFNFSTEKWMHDELTQVLRHPASRDRMRSQIVGFIETGHYPGVLVDLEGMRPSAKEGYHRFIRDLAKDMHDRDLQIEVAVPVASPGFFNYREIADMSDRVMLMAYDEHADGSAPGPICSIEWLDNVLKQRAADIPSEKTIIALGAYGYDWDRTTGQAREVTFEEAMVIASEAGADIEFDDRSLNSTFRYDDEDGHHHDVWYLDAPSLYNHVQIVNRHPAAMIAIWRLGAEDPAVWDVVETRERSALNRALERLHPGYELVYEGEGEMIRLRASQKEGRRAIEWDRDTPLISDQQIQEFPVPYTMGRYGFKKKQVALSFDDGPDPKYTPRILDMLRKYDVKATFFVIGISAEDDRDLVRREYLEGHEIGNHTFTHPNIAEIPARQLELELNACQRLIQSILSRNTILFRPPFNIDTDPRTPEEGAPVATASQMGYLIVGSANDPEDYRQPGVDQIVATAMTELKSGNIIMLHDSGGQREQTIAALPRIIEEVRKAGYEIVPLSTLLGKTRDDLMPPLSKGEHFMDFVNTISFMLGEFLLHFHRLALFLGVALGTIRFGIYAVMAVWQKRHHKEPLNPYTGPVDVVVPAHNEEKVIVYTIKSLLQSEGADVHVTVVDDGSTDNTLGVLKEQFGSNPRVTILTQPNSGKAAALNHGISKTHADVVITLDADTIFQHDCIRELVKPLGDPSVAAVAGNAKVGNRINILTRWQALEYVTSQNLDRRAHELINCITVVPGAVGAWRRKVLLEIGGYAGDTLAEDGELTIRVLKHGGRIVYAEGAVAWTEAPENLRNLVRQRFRWMFGTFQTAWKHRKLTFNPKYGSLGLVGMPIIFLFQVVFPFIAPLMDLTMYLVTMFFIIQKGYHPTEFASDVFRHTLFFYALFLAFDIATATVAMALEKKGEDWSLLVWLPWQRFFYRQLMHVIAIKSVLAALRGRIVGWGHITRNASHVEHFSESGLSEATPEAIHKKLHDTSGY